MLLKSVVKSETVSEAWGAAISLLGETGRMITMSCVYICILAEVSCLRSETLSPLLFVLSHPPFVYPPLLNYHTRSLGTRG